MAQLSNSSRILPRMPELTPTHIKDLQIFCAENDVKASEINHLLGKDLKSRLDNIRGKRRWVDYLKTLRGVRGMNSIKWWHIGQIVRLVGTVNKVLAEGASFDRLLAIIGTLRNEHIRKEAARYIPSEQIPNGVAKGIRPPHTGKRAYNDSLHVTG